MGYEKGIAVKYYSDRKKINRVAVKKKLKCFYINARSLVNKINELELYIKEENLDIVAVTETWFNSSIKTEVNIEGFTLVKRDRCEEGKS